MNEQDYLMHHGIKGMKWGVRRYQNLDGTWTNEGLKRRRSDNSSSNLRSSGSSKIRTALTSETAKKVYKGAALALTVAGAAYLYSRNRSAVNSVIGNALNRATNVKTKASLRGKMYLDNAIKAQKKAKSSNRKIDEAERQAIQRVRTTTKKALAVGSRGVSNLASNVKTAAHNWTSNFSNEAFNLMNMLSYESKKNNG